MQIKNTTLFYFASNSKQHFQIFCM